jgi:hypothetical protein
VDIVDERDTQPPGQLERVSPGAFAPEKHFYTRVLNASIHPLFSHFLGLTLDQVIIRFCHLNPKVDAAALGQLLTFQPRYLHWAGADLFHVTTAAGSKRMILIETNSSPSGQKSMPLYAEHQEQGGYALLIEHCFAPTLAAQEYQTGRLAVLYDKNYMEASGYAAAMADYFNEEVLLVPCFSSLAEQNFRFSEKVLEVRDEAGDWLPIRGALRYVTQKPWDRIPVTTRTLLFNPIVACLAGGRNKLLAAKAYDLLNGELSGTGLQIRVPETIKDVTLGEIPMLVRQFGGHAVIKIPYSNAGQGVFTITSAAELEEFLSLEHTYDKFVVQSLVGNYHWSSRGSEGRFYHVGTVPNKKGEIFVADLRMMIASSPTGYRPIAVYGRRAAAPLTDDLRSDQKSWDMLGTNLSKKVSKHSWDTETERLLLMDRKDFNSLGIGLDDLIRAFIQSVLASIAIDKMAAMLVGPTGQFRRELFRSLNPDPVLIQEVFED